MPVYEVSWNAFGTLVVEAENDEEAVEEAQSHLEWELNGLDWDGIDIGDSIEEAADWQTPVN